MTGPRRPPGATLREMCGYQWVCTPSRTSAAVAMGLSALVHQAAASWPSRFVAAQPDGALLAGQLLHMVCIFPIAGGRTLGWVESGLEQIVSRARVPTWPEPGPGSLVPQRKFEKPIHFIPACIPSDALVHMWLLQRDACLYCTPGGSYRVFLYAVLPWGLLGQAGPINVAGGLPHSHSCRPCGFARLFTQHPSIGGWVGLGAAKVGGTL